MGWNIELPPARWLTGGDPRLEELVNEIVDQDVVAIDTETTGLNIVKDIPLYWSMAWGEKRVCMPASTLHHFKQAFDDRTKLWIFANAKYDTHILANVGINVAGELVDTQVMDSLLEEEESHRLKDMAKRILGWKWTDFKETFGIKKGESIGDALMRMEREDPDKLIEYASNDAYGTLKIYEKRLKDLQAATTYSLYADYPTLADLFFRVEVPFTRVLWECEREGIYVDGAYLRNIENPVRQELESITREIVRLAGRMFNPKSNKDLAELFFNDLKLRPRQYTKGGKSGVKKPSIDGAFLEHYAAEGVPICKLMLRQRELAKLLGTYVEGLQKRVDENGRVHTRFNQDVARTGRLSSSDPNLQNVPRPDDDTFKIRGAFQASCPENCLIVGDYEQLEMRLLAAATVTDDNPEGEKAMIDIFLSGRDIHMGNAELVFGPVFEKRHGWRLTYDDVVQAKKVDKKVKSGDLPPEAMTERMHLALKARQDVKVVGFGLNYGMKENLLSQRLGNTKAEAKAIVDLYLETYPAVQHFYDSAIAETKKSGYSFTLLGRRRFHPEILSDRSMERWEAERKAVNNNIQGTAADAAKMAMIRISRAKLKEKYGARMLLQVHDELVFECPKETAEAARAEIKELMEHPFPTDLVVPLEVSIGIGPSWIEAK